MIQFLKEILASALEQINKSPIGTLLFIIGILLAIATVVKYKPTKKNKYYYQKDRENDNYFI